MGFLLPSLKMGSGQVKWEQIYVYIPFSNDSFGLCGGEGDFLGIRGDDSYSSGAELRLSQEKKMGHRAPTEKWLFETTTFRWWADGHQSPHWPILHSKSRFLQYFPCPLIHSESKPNQVYSVTFFTLLSGTYSQENILKIALWTVYGAETSEVSIFFHSPWKQIT